MTEPKLTRSQAAAELGVTVKTLYTWEKEGRIPPPERDWRGWRRYAPVHMEALRRYQHSLHPGREALTSRKAEGEKGRGGEGETDGRTGTDSPFPSSALRPRSVGKGAGGLGQIETISARNRLTGTITSIRGDGVLAEVVLDLGHGSEIVAVITQGSVERMGLRVGEQAIALIKATEVLLAR